MQSNISRTDGAAVPQVQTVSVSYSDVETIAMRVTAKAMNQVPAIAASVATQVTSERDKRREERENVRANHRNRNRVYLLMVALLMTFAIPYIIANVLGDVALLKYSTAIAVIPDLFLTLYAYWRKY